MSSKDHSEKKNLKSYADIAFGPTPSSLTPISQTAPIKNVDNFIELKSKINIKNEPSTSLSSNKLLGSLEKSSAIETEPSTSSKNQNIETPPANSDTKKDSISSSKDKIVKNAQKPPQGPNSAHFKRGRREDKFRAKNLSRPSSSSPSSNRNRNYLAPSPHSSPSRPKSALEMHRDEGGKNDEKIEKFGIRTESPIWSKEGNCPSYADIFFKRNSPVVTPSSSISSLNTLENLPENVGKLAENVEKEMEKISNEPKSKSIEEKNSEASTRTSKKLSERSKTEKYVLKSSKVENQNEKKTESDKFEKNTIKENIDQENEPKIVFKEENLNIALDSSNSKEVIKISKEESSALVSESKISDKFESPKISGSYSSKLIKGLKNDEPHSQKTIKNSYLNEEDNLIPPIIPVIKLSRGDEKELVYHPTIPGLVTKNPNLEKEESATSPHKKRKKKKRSRSKSEAQNKLNEESESEQEFVCPTPPPQIYLTENFTDSKNNDEKTRGRAKKSKKSKTVKNITDKNLEAIDNKEQESLNKEENVVFSLKVNLVDEIDADKKVEKKSVIDLGEIDQNTEKFCEKSIESNEEDEKEVLKQLVTPEKSIKDEESKKETLESHNLPSLKFNLKTDEFSNSWMDVLDDDFIFIESDNEESTENNEKITEITCEEKKNLSFNLEKKQASVDDIDEILISQLEESAKIDLKNKSDSKDSAKSVEILKDKSNSTASDIHENKFTDKILEISQIAPEKQTLIDINESIPDLEQISKISNEGIDKNEIIFKEEPKLDPLSSSQKSIIQNLDSSSVNEIKNDFLFKNKSDEINEDNTLEKSHLSLSSFFITSKEILISADTDNENNIELKDSEKINVGGNIADSSLNVAFFTKTEDKSEINYNNSLLLQIDNNKDDLSFKNVSLNEKFDQNKAQLSTFKDTKNQNKCEENLREKVIFKQETCDNDLIDKVNFLKSSNHEHKNEEDKIEKAKKNKPKNDLEIYNKDIHEPNTRVKTEKIFDDKNIPNELLSKTPSVDTIKLKREKSEESKIKKPLVEAATKLFQEMEKLNAQLDKNPLEPLFSPPLRQKSIEIEIDASNKRFITPPLRPVRKKTQSSEQDKKKLKNFSPIQLQLEHQNELNVTDGVELDKILENSQNYYAFLGEEFENSGMAHYLDYNEAEKNWHEKLGQKKEENIRKEDEIEKNEDEDDDEGSDDHNFKSDLSKKFNSGNNDRSEKGGGGGGFSKTPVTELLFSTISNISSYWLDWSTKLNLGVKFPENIEKNKKIDEESDINNEKFSTGTYLKEIGSKSVKDHLKEGLISIEETVKNAIESLSSLNQPQAHQITNSTQDLLLIFEQLQDSLQTVSKVISDFNDSDDEVNNIQEKVEDLSTQIQTLKNETVKLNLTSKAPLKSSQTQDILKEPLFNKSEKIETQSTMSDPNQNMSENQNFIKTVEVSHQDLPEEKYVGEMKNTETGASFSTTLEKTGFITRKKEVTLFGSTSTLSSSQSQNLSSFQSSSNIDPHSDFKNIHAQIFNSFSQGVPSIDISNEIAQRFTNMPNISTSTFSNNFSPENVNLIESAQGLTMSNVPEISSNFSEFSTNPEINRVNVRQVTQNVTRRVIRKRRRILRKVVVINGVETVTEEVIEEPDEVEEQSANFTTGPQFFDHLRPSSPGVIISEMSDSSRTNSPCRSSKIEKLEKEIEEIEKIGDNYPTSLSEGVMKLSVKRVNKKNENIELVNEPEISFNISKESLHPDQNINSVGENLITKSNNEEDFNITTVQTFQSKTDNVNLTNKLVKNEKTHVQEPDMLTQDTPLEFSNLKTEEFSEAVFQLPISDILTSKKDVEKFSSFATNSDQVSNIDAPDQFSINYDTIDYTSNIPIENSEPEEKYSNLITSSFDEEVEPKKPITSQITYKKVEHIVKNIDEVESDKKLKAETLAEKIQTKDPISKVSEIDQNKSDYPRTEENLQPSKSLLEKSSKNINEEDSLKLSKKTELDPTKASRKKSKSKPLKSKSSSIEDTDLKNNELELKTGFEESRLSEDEPKKSMSPTPPIREKHKRSSEKLSQKNDLYEENKSTQNFSDKEKVSIKNEEISKSEPILKESLSIEATIGEDNFNLDNLESETNKFGASTTSQNRELLENLEDPQLPIKNKEVLVPEPVVKKPNRKNKKPKELVEEKSETLPLAPPRKKLSKSPSPSPSNSPSPNASFEDVNKDNKDEININLEPPNKSKRRAKNKSKKLNKSKSESSASASLEIEDSYFKTSEITSDKECKIVTDSELVLKNESDINSETDKSLGKKISTASHLSKDNSEETEDDVELEKLRISKQTDKNLEESEEQANTSNEPEILTSSNENLQKREVSDKSEKPNISQQTDTNSEKNKDFELDKSKILMLTSETLRESEENVKLDKIDKIQKSKEVDLEKPIVPEQTSKTFKKSKKDVKLREPEILHETNKNSQKIEDIGLEKPQTLDLISESYVKSEENLNLEKSGFLQDPSTNSLKSEDGVVTEGKFSLQNDETLVESEGNVKLNKTEISHKTGENLQKTGHIKLEMPKISHHSRENLQKREDYSLEKPEILQTEESLEESKEDDKTTTVSIPNNNIEKSLATKNENENIYPKEKKVSKNKKKSNEETPVHETKDLRSNVAQFELVSDTTVKKDKKSLPKTVDTQKMHHSDDTDFQEPSHNMHMEEKILSHKSILSTDDLEQNISEDLKIFTEIESNIETEKTNDEIRESIENFETKISQPTSSKVQELFENISKSSINTDAKTPDTLITNEDKISQVPEENINKQSEVNIDSIKSEINDKNEVKLAKNSESKELYPSLSDNLSSEHQADNSFTLNIPQNLKDLNLSHRDDNFSDSVIDKDENILSFTPVHHETEASDIENPYFKQQNFDKIHSRLKYLNKSNHSIGTTFIISNKEIPQKLENLPQLLASLENFIENKNIEEIIEIYITLIETIHILIQNISYENSQLSNLTPKERHKKENEILTKIKYLTPYISQLSSLSLPKSIEAELLNASDNILKNYSNTCSAVENELENSVKLYEENSKSFLAQVSTYEIKIKDLNTQSHENLKYKSSPASKLQYLDELELEYQKLKEELEKNLNESLNNNLNPNLAAKLKQLYLDSISTSNFINSEREKILGLISLSDEYKQTLEEFEQIINLAENLLDRKLTVGNLKEFQNELQTHRRFFGNLRRCEHALEKLEFELDEETKSDHKNLHNKLYQKSKDILEKATRRKQVLAVTSARWAKLAEGIAEENKWIEMIEKKLPNIEQINSADIEKLCTSYQAHSGDVIIHQARLIQFKSLSDAILEIIECDNLTTQIECCIQNSVGLNTKITGGLRNLTSFRDAFSNYEKLIARLVPFLQMAEIKIGKISDQPRSHPYEFWELKAQYESFAPLKKEASLLLNQFVKIIPLRDEISITENFNQFTNRWAALKSQMDDIEISAFKGEDEGISLVESCENVKKEMMDIENTFERMNVVVENEEELYLYLEQLQILKAQILNNKHQLMSILSKNENIDPEDYEKISILLGDLNSMDLEVSEELNAAHCIRDKFSTFGRLSLKAKRTQDTLRARVDQWSQFFELSQDIFKQALTNCQTIDGDIKENNMELDKIRNLLVSFPSTPHLVFSTTKLETEVEEMETVIHTLVARVQDLKSRVEEQLGIWEEVQNSQTVAAYLVNSNSALLKTLLNEPPLTLPHLQISQRYLQTIQSSIRDSSPFEKLQKISLLIQKELPIETESSADLVTYNKKLISDWENIVKKTNELELAYSRARVIWENIEAIKAEIETFCYEIYPLAEFNQIEPSEVKNLLKSLEDIERKMSELSEGVGDVELTLSSSLGSKKLILPLRTELNGLGVKLEFIRSKLGAMENEGQEIHKITNGVMEETKNMLSNASEELNSEQEPSPHLLSSLHSSLLKLDSAQSSLRLQLPTSNNYQNSSQNELISLLAQSSSLFNDTFEAYMRIWGLVAQEGGIGEIVNLWRNTIEEMGRYLGDREGCGSKEQLSADLSLCGVYLNMLRGQYGVIGNGIEGTEISEEIESQFSSISAQLTERQELLKERLNNWKSFRISQNSLLTWLQNMEKEKRNLELPYLLLRRLKFTKTNIESLLNELPHGSKLVQNLKNERNKLAKFTNESLRASISQDVSGTLSRFKNLDAALKTWNDHVNRIDEKYENFETKYNGLGDTIERFRENIDQMGTATRFSELKTQINNLKKLRDNFGLTPQFEELEKILVELKAGISPSDGRLLAQKLWILNRQYFELMAILEQKISEGESKLDLLPKFDSRCKSWLVWGDCMQKRLECPPSSNLENSLELFSKNYNDEIEGRRNSYEWILNQGSYLSSMTVGKEKKEIGRVLEEIKKKWEGIKNGLERTRIRLLQLNETIENLNERSDVSTKRLKELEKYSTAPLSFQEFNSSAIDDAMIFYDIENKKLNDESSEMNQLLDISDRAISECEELNLTHDSSLLREKMQNLASLWDILIKSFETKLEILKRLKEIWSKLNSDCDYLESLVSQVNSDIEAAKSSSSISHSKNIADIDSDILKLESLSESAKLLAPKIEDVTNDYCYVTKQVNANSCSPLGFRVKNLLQNYRSAGKNCGDLLNELNKRLDMLKFNDVYNPAYGALEEMKENINSLNESQNISPDDQKELFNSLKMRMEEQGDEEVKMFNLAESIITKYAQLRAQIMEKLTKYNKLKTMVQATLDDVLKKSRKLSVTRGVEDMCVQVGTLPMNAQVQVDTFTSPNVQNPSLVKLSRDEIYENELKRAIEESESAVQNLDQILESSPSNLDEIVKSLAVAQSSIHMLTHLHTLLQSSNPTNSSSLISSSNPTKSSSLISSSSSSSNPTNSSSLNSSSSNALNSSSNPSLLHSSTPQISSLLSKFSSSEKAARALCLTLKDSHLEDRRRVNVVCPLCNSGERGGWESGVWRLEQWLQHTEGVLSSVMRKRPPGELEELEDKILDHRELVLDLDSHRSLVASLEKILDHLSEHQERNDETDNKAELDTLQKRIVKNLKWWKKICHNCATWQARLQIALIQNSDFHKTIEEYEGFLESAKETIMSLEPVNLSAPNNINKTKLQSFEQLSEKLVRTEPDLRTLHQTAEQLFVDPKAIESSGSLEPNISPNSSNSLLSVSESTLLLERIGNMGHVLLSLLRVSNAYIKYLKESTGSVGGTENLLLNLTEQISERCSSPARSLSPSPSTSQNNENNEGVFTRGRRVAYRAFRASLPFQALILLFIGAATLLPYTEDDFSCFSANNLARSLEPMLTWNAPPRI